MFLNLGGDGGVWVVSWCFLLVPSPLLSIYLASTLGMHWVLLPFVFFQFAGLFISFWAFWGLKPPASHECSKGPGLTLRIFDL